MNPRDWQKWPTVKGAIVKEGAHNSSGYLSKSSRATAVVPPNGEGSHGIERAKLDRLLKATPPDARWELSDDNGIPMVTVSWRTPLRRGRVRLRAVTLDPPSPSRKPKAVKPSRREQLDAEAAVAEAEANDAMCSGAPF